MLSDALVPPHEILHGGTGRDGRLYFPVAEKNPQYRRKSTVLGLEIDGEFKAYPFDELKNDPEPLLCHKHRPLGRAPTIVS